MTMSTQGGPAVGSISGPACPDSCCSAVDTARRIYGDAWTAAAMLREAQRLMERSEPRGDAAHIQARGEWLCHWSDDEISALAEAIEHTLLPELDRLEQEARA